MISVGGAINVTVGSAGFGSGICPLPITNGLVGSSTTICCCVRFLCVVYVVVVPCIGVLCVCKIAVEKQK